MCRGLLAGCVLLQQLLSAREALLQCCVLRRDRLQYEGTQGECGVRGRVWEGGQGGVLTACIEAMEACIATVAECRPARRECRARQVLGGGRTLHETDINVGLLLLLLLLLLQ